MTRPLILVCNDDGINATGIKALVEAVQHLGDVVVVAPDSPQSAKGHSITIAEPLRLHTIINVFGENVKAYSVSGTPVDCVKLAVDKVLHRKPDLLVSGINHGSNASINVIYSGTMSAALEGAIEGIQSVGFSLCDYADDADFTLAKSVATHVCQLILDKKIPQYIALNVNIPKIEPKDHKGIKICRQANSKWTESYIERQDPFRKNYYWMSGKFEIVKMEEDTDEWALAHHFTSIVPVQFDLTAYKHLDDLKQIF